LKAKLEFNLPDDRDEYFIHSRAQEYHSALWDIGEEIRNYYKYHNEDMDQLKNTIQKINKIISEVRFSE
jgi:hypothetical protein